MALTPKQRAYLFASGKLTSQAKGLKSRLTGIVTSNASFEKREKANALIGRANKRISRREQAQGITSPRGNPNREREGTGARTSKLSRWM